MNDCEPNNSELLPALHWISVTLFRSKSSVPHGQCLLTYKNSYDLESSPIFCRFC